MTKYRILVIDDEPIMRSLLQRGLGLAGFLVDTAESGEIGLLAVLQNLPDVVLLDLMMPGIFDGFATLERLLKLEPRPKVIVISGRDELEDRQRAMVADGFLVKPVGFDFLVQTIHQVIAGLSFQK